MAIAKNKSINWRRTIAVAAAIAIGTELAVIAAGARVNLTASMPLGLWIPGDGGAVTTCLPANIEHFAVSRGYVGHGFCSGGGWPELKRVAARPGDRVTLSSGGIAVNGRLLPNTRPLGRDSVGRALAAYPFGEYAVAPGEVWLYAPVARSFDSRYYGPVPINRMRAMKPLWTW